MARCCLKTPNTIEDIETFIDEHRQHHPEFSDDQGEASHRELEELSTLEEENITEEQNEDDVVIGDQLADALDLYSILSKFTQSFYPLSLSLVLYFLYTMSTYDLQVLRLIIYKYEGLMQQKILTFLVRET